MRRQILSSLLVGAAVLVSSELRAQQPAPPNLDAVPEKMPFSNAYGAPIGAKRANAVIEAAAAEASKRGWPMNIAVVDAGANLTAFMRMDGAWLGSIDIAINKAFTAKAFDISTLELGRNSQPKDQFFGIHVSNHARVMIFAGGIPIKMNGQIVGAVGVSGGSGEQDQAVAEAVVAASS